jgi:hypothetical protein
MIVAAAYFVATRRPVVAGALLGYISMFKYWVVALLGYFVLKRQWKAAVAFVVAVAAVLLVAHAAFDLGRFPFARRAGIDRQFGKVYGPLLQSRPFCSEVTGTAASFQAGVCAIVGARRGLAPYVFYGLVGVGATLFLGMFASIERRSPHPALRTRRGSAPPKIDEVDDRRRRILEFCFFPIAAGALFHSHYYYLSFLILPLTFVLYRNFWDSGRASSLGLVLALLAYAALSAFIVPLGLLSRVTGRDPWSFYLSHGIYAYGDVVLVGLLFWEYWELLRRAGRTLEHA